MISRAKVSSSSQPITTRSGRRKSLTASPSLRNSGFDTTWTRWRASRTSRRTRAFVPTGTVLLRTRTTSRAACSATVCATASTAARSAPPSARGGVPTAMKTAVAPRRSAPRSRRGRARRWGSAPRSARRSCPRSRRRRSRPGRSRRNTRRSPGRRSRSRPCRASSWAHPRCALVARSWRSVRYGGGQPAHCVGAGARGRSRAASSYTRRSVSM